MKTTIIVKFQHLTTEEIDTILSLRAKNSIKAFLWREGQGSFKLEEQGSGFETGPRTYSVTWEVK